MWCGLKNNMIVYADNSTLHATIKSSFNRLAVAESLNLDLKKMESWCDSWGMCLNPRKSISVMVSRSRTINPQHSLVMGDLFKLLGVLFDKKLTFEKHLRSVATSIAQKVGILRKCVSIYNSHSI